MNDFPLLTETDQQNKQKKRSDLFFLLAILFGLLLIFLEPPFVCPDENAHFVNICRISHGGLFADMQEGAAGCYITDEELDFLLRYGGLYNGLGNTVRFDYATMRALSERPASETMVFFETNFSAINPTAYVLPAVFVAIFRFLFGAINAYNALILSKFINLLFYAVVIRWAIRKTGAFSNTMFLLALMPMSIFQGASTSYDAFLIPSAFLLFAYTTKILRAEATISVEDIVSICFASACLFGVKIAYAPLVLILLSIPLKKFGTWKRWFTCVGLVAAMGMVFYLLPMLITSQITQGVTSIPTAEQLAQKAYVSENLSKFPSVIYHTVKQFGEYWLESFVGIIGWLDTNFPKAFILLFLVISTFNAAMDACSLRGIRISTRLLSLAGFAIFFVGTLYTMYVTWNPSLVGIIGGDIAYGGQGRYFIPVALFILIACANPLLERLSIRPKLEYFRERLIDTTAVASLSLTVLLLTARYWM